jgi:hypothetical protein
MALLHCKRNKSAFSASLARSTGHRNDEIMLAVRVRSSYMAGSMPIFKSPASGLARKRT